MAHLIDKNALVAEIKKLKKSHDNWSCMGKCFHQEYEKLLSFLDTLEVKEVNWEKERMEECPYRQVGCTMYEGKILECRGACSWVVDYPKLKELKAQKGE